MIGIRFIYRAIRMVFQKMHPNVRECGLEAFCVQSTLLCNKIAKKQRQSNRNAGFWEETEATGALRGSRLCMQTW